MTETLKTLTGNFYVGMKFSDCKTDEQREEFKRIDKLDGKISNILSGEDICKERDNENDKRHKLAQGIIFTGGAAMASGFLAPEGVGAVFGGAIFGLWNCATDRNTEHYKKQHNIKY